MTGTTAFIVIGLFLAVIVTVARIRSLRAERAAAIDSSIAEGTSYNWPRHSIKRVNTPTGKPVGADN